MKKTTGPYPGSTVDGAGSSVVPHAGSSVLLRTAQTVGLTTALSEALMPWRKPLARHDPGKIVAYLALSLAIGGDCLADIAVLRTEPEVFGLVASDPTVSRLVDALVLPVVERSGVQRPDGRVGQVEAAGAVEGFLSGAGG